MRIRVQIKEFLSIWVFDYFSYSGLGSICSISFATLTLSQLPIKSIPRFYLHYSDFITCLSIYLPKEQKRPTLINFPGWYSSSFIHSIFTAIYSGSDVAPYLTDVYILHKIYTLSYTFASILFYLSKY